MSTFELWIEAALIVAHAVLWIFKAWHARRMPLPQPEDLGTPLGGGLLA